MEFLPFYQNPHFPDSGVPDGFALVPLQLFLLMAHQLPMSHGTITLTTISKPSSQETVYDRAMSCSAN
jgi:hypothetical protein